MNAAENPYDVAIVGASLAGCTSAIFFARQGLRVALIERNSDPIAYKRLCTHFILSSAVPTIQRLGLADSLDRAGAVRNSAEFWTRFGLIRPVHTPEQPPRYGYSIRRQKLDPMLRAIAIETPGVDYFPGEKACGLLESESRVAGVRLRSEASGHMRDLHAKLTVAADGRYSTIAQLAGIPQTLKRNDRAAFFAYFRDTPLDSGSVSKLWLLEPDAVYAFPNDDGITLLAYMPHKDRLSDCAKDLEGTFCRRFQSLPGGPDVRLSNRMSPFLQMLDVPNISRRPTKPGLALIGDAAIASDPVSGNGCGWAFQSAEWLANHTASALKSGDPRRIDAALEQYRKAHRSALGGHYAVICDFSARKKFNLLEKLFFIAAVHDPVSANHFEAFLTREISLQAFLRSSALLRAAAVAARWGWKASDLPLRGIPSSSESTE